MEDSSPPASDVPENETPTQKQARLRRERRNAKLQSGGADRLGKIMNVSGRTEPPVADSTSQTAPQPSRTPSGGFPSTAPQPSMQASRQPMPMQMQDFDPDMSDPFNTPGDAGADPMMRMMQQMMAQAGGQQQQGSQGAMNEDPMMKLMHQFMGGEQAQQEQQQPATSVYVWRVVHAIVSTLLALYVGVSTAFNGSEMARTQPQDYVQGFGGVTNNNNNNNNNNGWFGGNNNNNNNNGFGAVNNNNNNNNNFGGLFYLFATAELVLQSSRYFMEKGRLQSSGIMRTLGQFLPEPYAGYLRMVGRYSMIYTTISADAMVIVFVLGLLAWWNGTGS